MSGHSDVLFFGNANDTELSSPLRFSARIEEKPHDLQLNEADLHAVAGSVFAFYKSLGAHFDLLFFDPSDRDAAYYQVQRGDGGAHWRKDADFERFGTFVSSIVRETGRWAIVWQVPVGNTIYRSMDNSWGHYQDNRLQYWLGDRAHAQVLADGGVIAVLFGAGADGCTTYTDEMNDGVTNPPPIDGNDQEAQYSDDDGGYLRLSASAYYQAGALSRDAAVAKHRRGVPGRGENKRAALTPRFASNGLICWRCARPYSSNAGNGAIVTGGDAPFLS